MNQTLVKALKQALKGEVKDDAMTQHIYSVDASIFEMSPFLVVLPKDEEDLIKTVHLAREFSTSIVPRGGATGIAGGCLGSGIVVDTSKYLNRILEFNEKEHWILCEPGVIQDDLNAFLAPFGLRLGPETSTSNRATIGGMCATNAAGSHFLRFGSMVDHVLEVDMILSNSEKRRFGKNDPFLPLQKIKEELPKDMTSLPHRSSSGYLIDSLLEVPFNPAKITVGSEGTLGIFSSIKLNLSPIIKKSSMILFSFDSLEESLEKVPFLLEFHPISLELLDHHIISQGRLSPALKQSLSWLKNDPKALLVVEFEEEVPASLLKDSKGDIIEEKNKKSLWALRKSGLGLLLSRRSYSRAIAFIEDITIPPQHLSSFVKDLKNLVHCEMGIYGHAGDGCLHIRPFVDLRNSHEVAWMFNVMEKIVPVVQKYKGALSGEHGDGLIRSWLNEKFFGQEKYEIFKKIKNAFDPLHLMNPGKIVEAHHPKSFLRKDAKTIFPTFLNFEKEGGFSLSADLCNGNGECRKKTGLMCPSFHAYGDERHTTRARAQSLRALLNKKASLDKDLLDVLDYCLECKGCKTECPSQVDMAKMKMEMLYQYQEKHGYFFLNRLFGNLPGLSKAGSLFSPFSNWILKTRPLKEVLSLWGIAKQRDLPNFTPIRFSSWFKKRKPKKSLKKILLFNDTFTEFHCPEVGKAAVSVLEKCGYQVDLIPYKCCGRTLLSKGMLGQAKKNALELFDVLKEKKDPIVVLEPSCLSALKDDYKGLIDQSIEVFGIESFLSPLKEISNTIFYHPHCHEQAIGDVRKIYDLFPNSSLRQSKGGCCGLAGSFGYEKKHYDMSMKIGEHFLFPQIRENSHAHILASGFSCRTQIFHGTQRHSLHLAEYYDLML